MKRQVKFMEKEKVQDANPIYPTKSNMPSLNVQNIVQLIQQHALTVTWEQAYRCPCVDLTTGQPQPNCNVCHGQGWIYLHPRHLDMMIQGDEKKYSITTDGMDLQGTSKATPQITVNSVEQGIKLGDRITVDGWTTTETYTFNVNQQRLKGGIFLPYKVQSVNEAFFIKDGELEQLDIDANFKLKDNFLQILSKDLLGKTISVALEVVKRFYVVSLQKEVRYEQYYKLKDKLWATGNGTNKPEPGDVKKDPEKVLYQAGNHIISLDSDQIMVPRTATEAKSRVFPQVVNRDGAKIVMGEHQVYRLPPLLILKRENLYFSDLNVVSSETDNRSIIHDPRATEFDEFLGDGE